MKWFFFGLILGLMVSVVSGQTPYPDDLDPRPFSHLMPSIADNTSPTGHRPVILLDETSDVPSNYEHVANFDAQCLTGGKGCKYPIKVYRVRQ